MSVTDSDVWGGLDLWLALREPELAKLFALGAAVDAGLVPPLISHPGRAGTLAIIGERGLAALVRREDPRARPGTFEVAARSLGADGRNLARRLAAYVVAWDASGRPSTGGLRVSAFPAGDTRAEESVATVEKRHSRLAIDWC
ncbi:MAG: hypothetical protein ACRDJN_11480 [Chloroflexota bacterium]